MITLVLSDAIARELQHVARWENETAGVLTVQVLRGTEDIRLLTRELHWVAESAYRRRTPFGLSIASEGYVPALGNAASDGAAALWLHTHPGIDACPYPSEHDLVVDEQLASTFRIRTGSEYYGALVIAPSEDGGFSFSGHLQAADGQRTAVNRVWVVGDRFRLLHEYGQQQQDLSPIFDRNVRAFGGHVQKALGDLGVGVVGCGGTGSAVAEQLVRLGVMNLLVIDPDDLSASNVTRVYGSHESDVGRAKVDILRDHLQRVSSSVRVEAVRSSLNVRATAERLMDLDVAFGCTDDNAGRLVLSRAASYLMLPVIDCGVLLSSGPSQSLAGIDGRVTILSPGAACLVCRDRIDLSRASSELMTPEERIRRVDEGYAPALGRVEPAVVPFTTAVAATAVGELLERLIGYGPEPRPSEILLRLHDREISTNVAVPRPGHYCDGASKKIGKGLTDPFLEQAWH